MATIKEMSAKTAPVANTEVKPVSRRTVSVNKGVVKSASLKRSLSPKTESSPTGSRKDMTAVMIWAVGSVLLVAALAAATYFYVAYRQAKEAVPVGNEVGILTARISRVMELPTGETPTLATVTEKEKLSGQEFFVLAENGDQVLIYEQAKRAILFRPSTGRIMNVAPISAQEPESPVSEPEKSAQSLTEEPVSVPEQVEDVPAPEGKARVVLLNGGKTVGITAKTERTVLGSLSEAVEILAKESASRSDYEGTVVADISGVRMKEVAMIADLLEGSVVSGLPEGETMPDDADILVIVGNTKK